MCFHLCNRPLKKNKFHSASQIPATINLCQKMLYCPGEIRSTDYILFGTVLLGIDKIQMNFSLKVKVSVLGQYLKGYFFKWKRGVPSKDHFEWMTHQICLKPFSSTQLNEPKGKFTRQVPCSAFSPTVTSN